MKRILLLLLPLLFAFAAPAANPVALGFPAAPGFEQPQPAKPKKPSRLQRWATKLLLRQWKKDKELTEKQRNMGITSMVLGLGSLLFLLVPPLGLLALPAGILAIVFGAKSAKGNGNAPAIVGIVTGSVTCAIFLLAIVIIALYLRGF